MQGGLFILSSCLNVCSCVKQYLHHVSVSTAHCHRLVQGSQSIPIPLLDVELRIIFDRRPHPI